MAELTVMEEKLAEVIGLAMAAQGATEKIGGLTGDGELAEKLERMNEEARETEERGTQLAGELDGPKAAVLDKARETKGEATTITLNYPGDDTTGATVELGVTELNNRRASRSQQKANSLEALVSRQIAQFAHEGLR